MNRIYRPIGEIGEPLGRVLWIGTQNRDEPMRLRGLYTVRLAAFGLAAFSYDGRDVIDLTNGQKVFASELTQADRHDYPRACEHYSPREDRG